MTQKDYVRLAAALRQTMEMFPSDTEFDTSRQSGVRWAVANVADALAADNPRFNRQRFYEACGL